MKNNSTKSNRRNFMAKGLLALVPMTLVGMKVKSNPVKSESNSGATVSAQDFEALQKEVTRLQDVNAIAKLQARYETIHCTDEALGWMLFADRPDTSKEITAAHIVGFENIKAGYMNFGEDGFPIGYKDGVPERLLKYYDCSAQGQKYTVHPIATPCIEVAADGETAKATFTSLGMEGGMWCYGKYANDYIKIDGEWYIWHMKWLRNFKTPFDTSWADSPKEAIYEFTKGEVDENGNPALNPDVSYNYLLRPDAKLKTISVPRPYDTWTAADENGAWWKKDTVKP